MPEFIGLLDRERLAGWLAKRGVDPAAYSLEGGHPSERYVLDQRGNEWVVFYSERGLETGLRSFQTEDLACRHLVDLLWKDHTVRPERERESFEPRTSSLSGKRVIRSDFRILANELQRAVRTRPLMSAGVAAGRYSVSYSPRVAVARLLYLALVDQATPGRSPGVRRRWRVRWRVRRCRIDPFLESRAAPLARPPPGYALEAPAQQGRAAPGRGCRRSFRPMSASSCSDAASSANRLASDRLHPRLNLKAFHELCGNG
jgi:hypothetical protein